MNHHEKRLLILVTDVMIATLFACEAMKSLGKDMEDDGEGIQKKAS